MELSGACRDSSPTIRDQRLDPYRQAWVVVDARAPLR